MIYLLLFIIIGFLIKLIYFPRDKGLEAQKKWNKLFNQKIELPDYKSGDPRNETHPDELVKLKDGGLGTRKLATLFEDWENKNK